MSEVSLAERQEVVRMIEAAWANAQYPGDGKIFLSSETNLDGLFVNEVNKIKEGFSGKHWREISLETLIDNRYGLEFCSVEERCFYLPAYMIASILQYATVDDLSNITLSQLNPPAYKRLQENFGRNSSSALTEEMSEIFKQLVIEFDKFADGFSVDQKAAICTFLELYTKLDDGIKFNTNVLRALNCWRRNAA